MTIFLKFSNLHSLNLNNLQTSRHYCSQRHMFLFCIQKTNASVLNIFICCFVCFFVILCHRGWKMKFFLLESYYRNCLIGTHMCVHPVSEWSVFLPFSVNCSQVAMFQIMSALFPHGQGERWWSTKCGQAYTGGGGPKNSQICADILYGWTLEW